MNGAVSLLVRLLGATAQLLRQVSRRRREAREGVSNIAGHRQDDVTAAIDRAVRELGDDAAIDPFVAAAAYQRLRATESR